ncbi:MAG TPA: OsmC family protein [Planctomycetota bacterium]|nr:OsmC family protein [Planctomycetota bacterium]HRR82026.1 OsmC family protein [Planctomycetota bacterium]HRT93560.1 OsmC family protein [Planctomycetota bacterium]
MAQAVAEETLINGVDVTALGEKAEALRSDPGLGKSRFRITNRWLGCGRNRSTVAGFHALRQDIPHEQTFELEADEPPVLLGTDEGANPVEYLLHALASCLTTSLVYHAAVRGIHIEEVESTLEGDLDIRGFMGLAPDVRKGYQNITVTFRVKSDAPAAKLRELANFSPVFDVVSHGTKVDLKIETRA